MRRRDSVAIIIFLPIFAGMIIYLFYPGVFQITLGYMLAVSLVFKSALLSFWTASKLKLIAYLKSLTFFQGAIVLIKRWFLDNIISKWLKHNIIDNISKGIKELKGYYSGLDLRSRIFNALSAAAIFILSLWILHYNGFMVNMVLFTELKIVVISISKTILLLLGHIFNWLTHSWLTPILEVFAFSWLFSWLEKRYGPEHPLNRFLKRAGLFFGKLFSSMGTVFKKYIDPLLNEKISRKTMELGERLSDYIRQKKITHEYEKFDALEREIMKGHINAYHSFKGMEDVHDKKKLYSMINKRTSDGINIVAFVSRNEKGDLLPVGFNDNFYNDVFIMEGIASSHIYGINDELPEAPDKSDFWILNTSLSPLVIKSHSGSIEPVHIEAQSLKMIKCPRTIDYSDGDLYAYYRGRTETFTAL